LKRPSITGAIIIFIGLVIFASQNNPNLIPEIPISFFNHKYSSSKTKYTIQIGNISTANINPILINSTSLYSKFIGIDKMNDSNELQKAFVRTIGDFLPLLSMPSDIKIGLPDYVIKIVSGALTFGLIAIALRRRFERKKR